ncbi:HNH endonuclease [Geodermatophilus marinus]|nr:HNH endonuclease [Geodermatophilus sp. LHW52908]
MVQRGLDLIRRDGAVTVDVPTLGHRSSFVGAVLATLPGVTVSGSPPRLTLPVRNLDGSGRPAGDEEFEDPAIPPGYDERNKAHRAIVQRRGQKAFRDGLLAAYEGACAVTGTAAEAVLEAAHIRPYRGQLHNTVTNGLLLRADIHTLFDLHLLTVLPVGSIRISPELDGTLYAELDERMVRRPASPPCRPSPAALEEHNAACGWLLGAVARLD